VAAELAAEAERAGWHGFFVWEPVWGVDAWMALTAAAMTTREIRLGTMLTPLPRRRPCGGLMRPHPSPHAAVLDGHPGHRFELVVLDRHPGTERGLEHGGVRGGDRRPAHRVEEGSQPLRWIERSACQLRQRAGEQHPAARLDLPDHIKSRRTGRLRRSAS
jgi:hypothetical protein